MTATDNQALEEQNNLEPPKVDTSALDSVTKNIAIDAASIDTSGVEKVQNTLKKEQAKPNINIKSKEDTLGIPDITSYIQQRKAQQEAENNTTDTLHAKDGTDLQSLPHIYAVVPHKKGDHKLVFMRSDIENSFLEDPKQRKKGGVYEKNGNKVYDVHVDFMQHPTLKTARGEAFTIWVVDTKEDLQKQLQSIQGGAGRGTNFLSPVYVEKTATKKPEEKKTADTQPKATTQKSSTSPTKNNKQSKPLKEKTETKKITPPNDKKQNDKPKKIETSAGKAEKSKKKEQQANQEPVKVSEKIKESEDKKTPTKPFELPTFDLPPVENTEKKPSQKDSTIPEKNISTKDTETKKTTTERKLPEFKEESTPPPVDVSKVVEEGDKKQNSITDKPFVLPDFEFDKDGNVVKDTQEKQQSPSELSPSKDNEDKEKKTKKTPPPFTLPDIPVPDSSTPPTKKESPSLSQPKKSEDTLKEPSFTIPKKPESIPKESQPVNISDSPIVTEQKEEKAPPPFMLDLDDIVPKTPTNQEKPVIQKTEQQVQPTTPKKSIVEEQKPVFDLDAITEISPAATPQNIEQKTETTPNPINLDTVTSTPQTSTPVQETSHVSSSTHARKHRHAKPPKRSKKGLRIRIAGLIALPILLLTVLIVMFPSLKGNTNTQPAVITPTPGEKPEPAVQDPTPIPDPQPNPEPEQNSQFTMTELKAKLESQQIEARRVLNKAKLLNNKEAIKFGTAALLMASKTLDTITKNTTTADEVQQDVEKIQFYLDQADNAVH